VEFAPGVSLKLAPFFGSIGVAPPPLVGRISSRPPGCMAAISTTRISWWLDAVLAGARTRRLLSVGDGHGMQGDGEVTGTALETSLRAHSRYEYARGSGFAGLARNPFQYITMGLHEDLDEATRLATREMIEFLVTDKGLSRDEAYVLCALAADLHVTQAVDQTKGVHATIAKSIFK